MSGSDQSRVQNGPVCRGHSGHIIVIRVRTGSLVFSAIRTGPLVVLGVRTNLFMSVCVRIRSLMAVGVQTNWRLQVSVPDTLVVQTYSTRPDGFPRRCRGPVRTGKFASAGVRTRYHLVLVGVRTKEFVSVCVRIDSHVYGVFQNQFCRGQYQTL